MRYTLLTLGITLVTMGCRPGKTSDPTTQQEDVETTTESDTDNQTDTDSETDDETDNNDEGEPEEDEQNPDDQDDPDESDDPNDKPDDTGLNGLDSCGADFDPEEPCQGSWEETLCTYEGLTWWCQDGVWMNENDKPD